MSDTPETPDGTEPAILDDLRRVYRRAEVEIWPFYGPEWEMAERRRLHAHLSAIQALSTAVKGCGGKSAVYEWVCGIDGDLCGACQTSRNTAIQALLGEAP